MYKHLLVVSNGRPFTRKFLKADETNIVLSCVEHGGVKKIVADVCPADQPVEEAMQNPMARMEFSSFSELLENVKDYGAALIFHESMDSLL